MIAGCGPRELAPLTGNVTLDGQPLPTAIVTFFSVADGSSGYGSVDDDGSYVARTGSQPGLKPGEYRISVVAYQPEVITDRAREKAPKAITPPRYGDPETSGLSYTLPPSGGKFAIELTSK